MEVDEKPVVSITQSPIRPLHEEMAEQFLDDLQQNMQRQQGEQEQEHTWIVHDDEQGMLPSSTLKGELHHPMFARLLRHSPGHWPHCGRGGDSNDN
jgi:hypothetical protein